MADPRNCQGGNGNVRHRFGSMSTREELGYAADVDSR